MNILLVNPPREHELVGKNPALIEENRGYNPPLGLLSLATAVSRFAPGRHQVRVLDCQPQQLSYDEIDRFFAETAFDLVGLTAMTFTLIDVAETVRRLNLRQPHCKVVLGGPHTHLFPAETLAMEGVDYVIQGEGEYAFLELLEALEGARPLQKVSGLAFREGGHIINNGIAPHIPDLDALPWPDRTFLPLDHYGSLLAHKKQITTMFTSRGCPFRCTFCDRPNSPVISGFRWRSARNVVEEMTECTRLGISEILIYDDTFSVNRDRAAEICEEILARKLRLTWDVRAHVNTVDSSLLRLMRRAGCERIHYGVECGNDRMLQVIRKGTTVARIREAFRATREAGIETLAYFMIGLPSETMADIRDVSSLALELKPDYAHFTIFCPYPGTELYHQGLKRGIIRTDVWREFASNPRYGFELPVWEENFTRAELQELLVKLYRKFYTRPSYVLQRLGRVRSLDELKKKARAGLAVLCMKPENVSVLDLRKASRMK